MRRLGIIIAAAIIYAKQAKAVKWVAIEDRGYYNYDTVLIRSVVAQAKRLIDEVYSNV